MSLFFSTATLFVTAMAVHLLLWRVRLPKQQIRALLVIFSILFLFWLGYSLVNRTPMIFLLCVGLYYWSVSLCYTITYSAIESDSPTLSLMRFMAESGSAGRSIEDIVSFMAGRPFIGARLAALVKSGLIREQDRRYVIAGKRPLAFQLILGFRRLYGSIPKGG